MKEKVRKLKIVFITEYFPSKVIIDVRGGVELRTYFLTSKLSQKHEVLVIASNEQGKPESQIINRVKVKRVGFKKKYQQKGGFLNRLSFIIASVLTCLKMDFDIVEGVGFLGQISAFIISRLKKIISIAFIPDTFSDIGIHFNFFERNILKLTEKIIFNNLWDGFIVISDEVKRKLKKFKIPEEKIKVIYCGINEKIIENINVKKNSYPSICVINRLVSYKRTEDILYAIFNLKKILPQIKCHIIGDGEQSLFLKKLVDKFKLRPNVIFHGFIRNYKQVLKILKSSWIYCSASLVEGFGLATIEAVTAFIPFVVADIPVNREVTKGIGGLFFKPKDPNDLSKKLKMLLQDEELRKKIVAKNSILISRYKLERMVLKTEVYYHKLINNRN